MSQQNKEENDDIIQPIKEKMKTSKYCTEHPKEINRMYCTDCNSLVCGDCIVGPHHQHSFDKISRVTEAKFQELQDFIEKLKTQIQPEFLQHMEKMEEDQQAYSTSEELIQEEINNRIENLKNELDNIRNELNDEVQQKLQNDLEKLESSKLTVKENLEGVGNTIKESEAILSQLESKTDREALLLIMEVEQDLEKFESQTEIESIPLPTFLSLGLDESMKTKINNYIDSEAVKEHFNETPRTAVNGDDDNDNDDINKDDDNMDENHEGHDDEENMVPSNNQKTFEDLDPDDLENEDTNNVFGNLTQDKAFKPVQRSMEYDDKQDEDNQKYEQEPSKYSSVKNIPLRSKRDYLNNKTEEFDRITEEEMDSDDPNDNRQLRNQNRRLSYNSDQLHDSNMNKDESNTHELQSDGINEINRYKGFTNSEIPDDDDILQEALDILNEEVEDSSIQYEVEDDDEDGDNEYDFKIKKKKKGKEHKVKNKHKKEQHIQEHKAFDDDNMGNDQTSHEKIDRRKDDKTDRENSEQLKQVKTKNREKMEVYQQRKLMQEYKTNKTEPELLGDRIPETQVKPEMSKDRICQTQIQPERSGVRNHQTQDQREMSRDRDHKTRVQNVRSSSPEVKQAVQKRLSDISEKVINISKTKTSFIGKIDTTKVFGRFDSKCMSVLSDSEVWVGNSSKNELALIGYNSEILQTIKTIKTDFTFEAIATTQTGELLVTETSNGLIRKITKQNKIETFADVSPFWASCIYVTESNNLLCGLMKQDGEAKVIKMSAKGRIALTFQYDERNRKQLFKKPFSITQNKNRDIWVVEDSLCSPVKVIDKNGKFKFTYTGLRDTSTFGKFSPSHVLGVNTNVLVSDDNNHSVHLVDQEGHFLCFVIFKDEQIRNPTSLDKDSDGNIWIRCADNKINVVSLY